MDMGFSSGLTDASMRVILRKIINMATEFINTKTKAGIWEHGLTTNNTGLVSTNQAMANATSDVGETANLLMLLILML
jgi:hypothetical protein